MKDTTTDPLDRSCPACSAVIGEACKNALPNRVHRERLSLSRWCPECTASLVDYKGVCQECGTKAAVPCAECGALPDEVCRTPGGTQLPIKHGEIFVKHDDTKPRFSLLPQKPLEGAIAVLEYGAKKYSPDNWSKCKDPLRYYDAMMRHVLAYRRGETHDKESGLPHLDHALCCLLFWGALSR